MQKTSSALLAGIQQLPVVNTHAHQKPQLDGGDFDLDKLLRNSYTGWLNLTWGDTPESRADFLAQVRYNAYFHWLEAGLKAVYGFEGRLDSQNWDALSAQIQTAHRQPEYWNQVLTGSCRYTYVIQDSFWQPGSNNGFPQVYRPTFRINAFLFSYRTDCFDHNQNNALQLYHQGKAVDELDEYVDLMQRVIIDQQRQGCVALKLPVAYDRGLDFHETTRAAAHKAYQRLKTTTDSEDVKVFQDYILFELCRIAAERSLPLQIHTGMGKLERSNALWLQEVIQKHPQVKFVLLHCSYPWIDDVLGLLRTYANVYPDLAWLPQLNGVEARRMIAGLIESGSASKACWGCDTWTPEESRGSLLAFQSVLALALADQVESGYLTTADAQSIARQITSENALKLYGH